MGIIDLLLPLLLRLANGFDLQGKVKDAAHEYSRSFVEDRWRKAVSKIVKRIADEGITLDHKTEVRTAPPSGYVAFVLYRLWASVLKGGIVVDAFRDAQEPKITPIVAGQLSPTDHEHNVRAIINEALRLTF